MTYKTDDERKAARRAASKKNYNAHKPLRRTAAKAWDQAHPERRKELNKNWRAKNLQKVLLINAKRNAKNNNREFNLTIEDIIIPTHCPILGMPLTFGDTRQDSSFSVDRIDNSKGYVKGNIRIMSNLANSMKRHASKEQLLIFCKNMLTLLEETS